MDKAQKRLPGFIQREFLRPCRAIQADVTAQGLVQQVEDRAPLCGAVAINVRPDIGFVKAPVIAVDYTSRPTGQGLDQRDTEALFRRSHDE